MFSAGHSGSTLASAPFPRRKGGDWVFPLSRGERWPAIGAFKRQMAEFKLFFTFAICALPFAI